MHRCKEIVSRPQVLQVYMYMDTYCMLMHDHMYGPLGVTWRSSILILVGLLISIVLGMLVLSCERQLPHSIVYLFKA